MRLFIATYFLIASLSQSVPAQSNVSPTSNPPKIQTKQDKKDQKAKVRTEKEKAKSEAAPKGKKTTATQDAAYAAAYGAGIPKP